jgi:hypothetical protein
MEREGMQVIQAATSVQLTPRRAVGVILAHSEDLFQQSTTNVMDHTFPGTGISTGLFGWKGRMAPLDEATHTHSTGQQACRQECRFPLAFLPLLFSDIKLAVIPSWGV